MMYLFRHPYTGMTVVLLILCALLFSFGAQAATLDSAAFKRIPIVHDGRVKPLDTFARAYLYRLSGGQSLDGQTASEWLAESLFRPDLAIKQPLIRLPNKRIASALELEFEKNKRYSYQQVATAFDTKRSEVIALIQKGEENLNRFEKEFLDFYGVINDYSQITRAMTLVLPNAQSLPDAEAKRLEIDPTLRSYADYLTVKDRIVIEAQKVVKKYGSKIESYSQSEQHIAMLAFYLANIEATGKQNTLFRVIPPEQAGSDGWQAPWALAQDKSASPKRLESLIDWQQLATAYYAGDAALWQQTATAINQQSIQADNISAMRLHLEVWYHQLNPTLWIMIGYGLAFILLLISSIDSVSSRQSDAMKKAAALIAYGAMLLHVVMIITRIIILERPPVGTLYESVLFVALIAALLAWRLDKHSQANEGKMIACLLGGFLIGISGLFADQGDTLGVLVAVLNTNFWLATHVVCITIGYGCALVAGSLAHLYLLGTSDNLGKKLQTAALIALLFTAVGTILGGIWADQSWGRFWGWDPKENGALAIVIWLIWLLHGRITGHLKTIGFAAGLAVTNIIVALSWFGVNLLNVGLHSYGFTNSAAYGLAAFCSIELIVIIALSITAKRRLQYAQ